MSNLPIISVMMQTENVASLLLKGGIESDHERLSNRHRENQHTINAITGLREFAEGVNTSLGAHSSRLVNIENSLNSEGIHELYCNYYEFTIVQTAIFRSYKYENFPFESVVRVNSSYITDGAEVGVVFKLPEEQLAYGIAFVNAENITTEKNMKYADLFFYFANIPARNITFYLKITGGELKNV